MRATGLVILGACLLASCVPEYGAPIPSASATRRTTGSSSQSPVIQLSNTDSGGSITVRLCYSLFVMLERPPVGRWRAVQSSDETTLAVVPLPLPQPPNGGTNAVFLAKRIGSAELSSRVEPRPTCISRPALCPTEGWFVRVTLV